MSWAYGTNSRGEEVGYGVIATCDLPGCGQEIDRGLWFCCGGLEGVEGTRGCGHYFCGEHITACNLCVGCVSAIELAVAVEALRLGFEPGTELGEDWIEREEERRIWRATGD